jgi:3alpha(or 20beta)-hydroxysteroid dehydrogenase
MTGASWAHGPGGGRIQRPEDAQQMRRSVIVTGGTGGIGEAVCCRFAAAGFSVIIADLDRVKGAELEARLGSRTRFVELDVTDEAQWRHVVATANVQCGPVTTLVNNAGVINHAGIAEDTLEGFKRVIDVNLVGAWLGMRAALPSLRAAGNAAIVNVSSTAGMAGMAGIGSYVASKWGVRGLTKAAALELAREGIRVCSVHPGPTRSAMTARYDDSRVARQPIARLGHAEEVAEMVWFVATQATFSTGSEFVVDGGTLLGTVG